MQLLVRGAAEGQRGRATLLPWDNAGQWAKLGGAQDAGHSAFLSKPFFIKESLDSQLYNETSLFF